MSEKKEPNPNCPECRGTGEVEVWVWADGDRKVAEQEGCPVCYPPNPVHLALALAGFWTIFIGMCVVCALWGQK